MTAISYNGFEFPKRTTIEINLEPVYDEANRVVIARKYMIMVRSTILPNCEAGGDSMIPGSQNFSINNTMDDIRTRLSDSGKPLFIGNAGFGKSLLINGGSGGLADQNILDIRSGPKPRVLRWLPIGHESAAEITWQVEATVSPCGDDEQSGLMSLNYGVSFQINRSGFTTKRVQGHLTVAQHKINGQSTASADDFRDSIQIERLTNSQREQSYSLSTDKSRLDFSIVDIENESPNSYPAGVVSISAPMRSRILMPNPTKVSTQNSFTLRMTLEPRTARIRAWEIFQRLFELRVSEFVDAGIQVIITDLDIEEDWFTHEYRFGVNYRIVTDFVQFLQNSSYFRAFPVDWQPWSEAMDEAQSSRGQGKIEHKRDANNDKLTRLCNQDPTQVAAQATPYFTDVRSIGDMCNDEVPPNKSWLLFDAELIEEIDNPTVHHTTYGEVDISQSDFDIQGNSASQTIGIDYKDVDVELSVSAPIRKWTWRGQAQRISHPIPPIGKIEIGGVEAMLLGDPKISCRQRGTLFCQPVYECVWSIGLTTGPLSPGEITDAEVDPSGTNNDNTPPDSPAPPAEDPPAEE